MRKSVALGTFSFVLEAEYIAFFCRGKAHKDWADAFSVCKFWNDS